MFPCDPFVINTRVSSSAIVITCQIQDLICVRYIVTRYDIIIFCVFILPSQFCPPILAAASVYAFTSSQELTCSPSHMSTDRPRPPLCKWCNVISAMHFTPDHWPVAARYWHWLPSAWRIIYHSHMIIHCLGPCDQWVYMHLKWKISCKDKEVLGFVKKSLLFLSWYSSKSSRLFSSPILCN